MKHSFNVGDRVARALQNGERTTVGTINEITSYSVNVTWDSVSRSGVQWTSHFGPGCDIDSELTHLSPVEELALCRS